MIYLYTMLKMNKIAWVVATTSVAGVMVHDGNNNGVDVVVRVQGSSSCSGNGDYCSVIRGYNGNDDGGDDNNIPNV